VSRALFEVDLAGGLATRQYAALPLFKNLDTAYPWGTLHAERYSPDLVERARLGWTENAFNEFATGVAMGQLVAVLGEAGVPLDLWSIAASFPIEELLHVELCSRVAMELGGGAPIAYETDDLTLDFDPDLTPLQRANELVVRLCCVGEVFSLPLLAGSMRAATHPLTAAVLTQIVRDEGMHGQLGWMYLDWVSDALDPAERARLAAAATDTAEPLREVWQRLRVGEGPSEPGYQDMGWMHADAYVDKARSTLEAEVFGRLATYGIAL